MSSTVLAHYNIKSTRKKKSKQIGNKFTTGVTKFINLEDLIGQ